MFCIKAGTYSGTLRSEVSGSVGNKITFKAFPEDECVDSSNSKTCKVKIINGNYLNYKFIL